MDSHSYIYQSQLRKKTPINNPLLSVSSFPIPAPPGVISPHLSQKPQKALRHQHLHPPENGAGLQIQHESFIYILFTSDTVKRTQVAFPAAVKEAAKPQKSSTT